MSSKLNNWLERLLSRPLPLLDTTRVELNDLISRSQLSMNQYAQPILHDPGFCVQVLKKTNAQRLQAGRQPLTTISNAMSHLGQGQLNEQISQAQSMTDLAMDAIHQQGYLRYVAQACHAAYQARDWAQARHTIEPEEMQLASLLQNIAELGLWCLGDNTMPEIEHRAYGKKQDFEKAAFEVLGCSLRDLSAALAEVWHLPELVVQGMKTSARDFTLASGATLASRLARLSSRNWHSEDTRQCIEAIANYQGKAADEVGSHIHQTAVALTDDFVALGYLPPAFLLPMLADDDYIDPQFQAPMQLASTEEVGSVVDKASPQTVPAEVEVSAQTIAPARTVKSVVGKTQSGEPPAQIKARPKSVPQQQQTEVASVTAQSKSPVNSASTDNPALTQAVAEIQRMVKAKVHAKELIEQVVETIKLLGVERVVFAVRIPQKKLLYGRFFAQDSHIPHLDYFRIELGKPHVFSLLMEKSQHIWLNDSNRAKYRSMLPDVIRHMLGVESFMAMSIFTQNHAVGLMYADKVKGQLTADEYKKFQGLCRMLSRGMVEISHTQQKD